MRKECEKRQQEYMEDVGNELMRRADSRSVGVYTITIVIACVTLLFSILAWFEAGRVQRQLDQIQNRHFCLMPDGFPEEEEYEGYEVEVVPQVDRGEEVLSLEERLRSQILSSPRIQILNTEPGPADGQYWHYHRYHACHCHNILFADTIFQYLPQWTEEELEERRLDRDHRYTLCTTHFCGYPTTMPDHVVIRCEDPDCDIYRFYQPTWRSRLNHFPYDWPGRRRSENVQEEE